MLGPGHAATPFTGSLPQPALETPPSHIYAYASIPEEANIREAKTHQVNTWTIPTPLVLLIRDAYAALNRERAQGQAPSLALVHRVSSM